MCVEGLYQVRRQYMCVEGLYQVRRQSMCVEGFLCVLGVSYVCWGFLFCICFYHFPIGFCNYSGRFGIFVLLLILFML